MERIFGKASMNTRIPPAIPLEVHGVDFAERVWKESWTYLKTVVDTVREPFLVLDKELCVMVANDSFYQTFKVKKEDTEQRHVYELGNGQWNIPVLRKLLEEILPKDTFFKGFEVTHNFPVIGKKVMILNARRIYREDANRKFPPIILLAMEDVTEHMILAERLTEQSRLLERELHERTRLLETHIETLSKEVRRLNAGLV
jgi:PAS domain-containing protein